MIKTFSDFMNESKSHDAAGIAIVYDGKILLVHPANGSWVKPIMGIPKGGIEPGEDILEAALRELNEETGISLSADKLDLDIQTVHVFDKNGNPKHALHYFVCKIKDLSEIGLDSLAVPKTQLQKEEIDWAGFVNIKEAYGKVSKAQLIILDRLS
jgi:8-oxo-dGTP pyrophosphatase MutT (NUDIX family)